jgi:hypothetical protein
MNSSPQPTSIAQVFSPGEVPSKYQATLLRRQNFAAALGHETVVAWELDWDLLENPDVSILDPRKTILIKQLHTRLNTFSRKTPNPSNDFKSFHYDFIQLRTEILGLHEDRLEVCARQFFVQRFPNLAAIDFSPKVSGVQMGSRTRVTLPNGKPLNYHIKTHSGGRIASHSSGAKRVDPRELLIYKFLEHAGLGCESHFFHRSLEDVFIATLDAGHAEGSRFLTFQQYTGIQTTCAEPICGETLWGLLYTQLNHQKDLEVIEDSIQSSHIARNFLLQMASLDMISRIFRLHDLLNNADNFGFCSSFSELPCLKVLDFHLSNDTDMNLGPDHFRGFLVGNGMFNYLCSHSTLKYVCRDRPVTERIKTALHLLTVGSLCNSHDCIQRAHADVRLFFESSLFSDRDLGAVTVILADLEVYTQALHHNIDFFTSALSTTSSDSGSLM